MRPEVQALAVLLPVSYLVATFLYAMYYGGPNAPSVRLARRTALVVSLVLHGIFFACLGRALGRFPVYDPWTTVSAMGLILAALYVCISFRSQQAGTGVIVVGTAAVMQLLASAFAPLAGIENTAPLGIYYAIHGLTSLFAASALMLSGIYGALYLAMYRRMRGHRFGPLVKRLPSLRTLARLTRRSALAGFVLLTIGVNAGIAWAHAADTQRFRYSDPWVLAMLVLWIHFGLVAFSRRIPGLTARRASYAATFGLSLFLLMGLLSLIPSVTFHWQP